MHLKQDQARRFLLAYQGLWPPQARRGKAGVLEHIRRVGCIQYDPLNIAGSSPELTLQARVADFRPAMLYELLYQDRKLLDGLDKVMSIYPVEDWPYFRRRREAARQRFGDSAQPATAILPQVRQAITERGPLSSLDLDHNETVDWAWAPTRLSRAALESMYLWGELVIHHKVHTRKVYDFARRHIAHELLAAPEPNPTDEAYHDWYVYRRLGGIGLLWNKAGDAWLGMREIKSRERTAALERLVGRGRAIEVAVEGLDTPCYLRAEDRALLEQALDGDRPAPRAAILAPLDNLLWDRRFIRRLFGFSYIWEVYKPVAEREYGYYVLPILYGDRFVARFEPGRDKRSGALVVKNWWWEEEVKPSAEMQAELQRCFRRFLSFLDAPALQIDAQLAARPDLRWLAEIASVAT